MNTWIPDCLAGRSRWERLGQGLMLLLLVMGFAIGLSRVLRHGCSDFLGFYEAGEFVLQCGCRHPSSTLARYWPSVDVPFALLAWMPLGVAAAIWGALNCAAWLGLLGTLCHLLPDADPPDSPQGRAGRRPVGPAAGPGRTVPGRFPRDHGLADGCRPAAGQSGPRLVGGILLGLAVWIKLLPGLGVGYLL